MAIRVLQISPFPATDTPDTGGTIRIAETAEAYRRAGCLVDQCCIVTKARHLKNDLDLLLPWIDRFWRPYIGKPKNIGPIRQLWSTLRSEKLLNQLTSKIAHAYDIVHIEHPWSIQLAKGVCKHAANGNSILVYGSHNIENQFYEQLWRKNGSWNANAEAILKQIRDAEINCARNADVIWAVSESDAKILSGWGSSNVILAPNGCRQLPNPTPLPSLPQRPYVIFVGGNFPPNRDGFATWVGTSLKYLPTGTSIVAAGMVGDLLCANGNYHEDLEEGRFINYGKTDQQLLDQLILHAHAVILPVTQGGGTNLKTAEALCAQRPIISTKNGMRGFPEWESGEQVHVCESPKEFQEAIRIKLKLEYQPNCNRDVTSLHWERCLENAVRISTRNLEQADTKKGTGDRYERN